VDISLIDSVKTSELFYNIPPLIAPLFDGVEYPWGIFPKIKSYVTELVENGIVGYSEIADGVLVGDDVHIYPNVIIEPPAIIGHGTVLRPGAFIRGSVFISENCVIGNSTEVKNAVLMDRAAVPHYNYVGDSVLGCGSHLGAGAVCSNLKNDGKNITVHGIHAYETNLRKFGAIIGDGANVGCGCVLNPGCVIGRGTNVYPNLTLRGVFPPNSVVKSNTCITPIEYR
jgi:NDP-sugar pyrophosphorylase family protein